MEELESQVNSDATESSSPSTASQEAQPAQGEAVSAQPAEAQKQDTTPFHEHPRFKELVEQKNQALAQAKALQEQYSRMEGQLKQLTEGKLTQKQEDALIARLKGIDPEFGARFEKLDATQQELAELKAWKQELEAEKTRERGVSMVNSLHEQNKVSAEMRKLYNDMLDARVMRGDVKTLEQIPQVYKEIHDMYTKMAEDIKRSERETYVKDKKVDAKIPTSQPKGKPASGAKETPFSKDREQALAEVKSRILKQTRASDSL